MHGALHRAFLLKQSADDSKLEEILDTIQANVAETLRLPSEVRCSARSASGVYIGLQDGTVGLLSATGEFSVAGKHKGSVTAMDCGAGVCVSGSEDETLGVWGASTGAFAGISLKVTCVKVTPTDLCAACGSNNYAIKVVRISDLSEVGTLKGHTFFVRCLATADDGKQLLSGSDDKTVRIWALNDMTEVAVFHGHNGSIKCISVFPQGDSFATGSNDGLIKVWSRAECTATYTLEGHSGAVLCLLVSQDGSTLITGSDDRTIKYWSTEARAEIATLTGHSSDIRTLLQSRDYIFSASDDKTIKMWSIFDPCEIATFCGHTSDVSCIALSSDEKKLISGSFDATAKVWGLENLKRDVVLRGHTEQIWCMCLTTDAKMLVTGGNDQKIIVWALDTMKLEATLEGHRGTVTCLALTPDGSCLLSGSSDQTVKMWNFSSFLEVASMRKHSDSVTSLIISHNGKYAISGSDDDMLALWELSKPTESSLLMGHSDQITCIVVTQDELYAVSGSKDNTIIVWNLQCKQLAATLHGHSDSITSLVLTPNDKRLISASVDATIRVWDMHRMQEEYTITGHSCWVTSLDITPDGELLVSGAADHLTKAWKVVDGTHVATLFGHTARVDTVVLCTDGKHLVTASGDKNVKLWNIEDMQEVTTIAAINPQKICLSATHQRSLLFVSEESAVRCIDLTLNLAQSTEVRKLFFPALERYQPGSNSAFGSCLESLKTGLFVHSQAARLTVTPYFFNVLHVCCFYNNFETLAKYLHSKVPLIRGYFGSPLTVALRRNTEQCMDVALEFLTALSETGEEWNAVKPITEDLPMLLQSGSAMLVPFISSVFRASLQPDLPKFISPKEKLPMIRFFPSRYVRLEEFANSEGEAERVVEFLVSAFRWNFESGSSDSLQFLVALEKCQDSRVMRTSLVTLLLYSKWTTLKPFILARTAVYGAMLACLVWITFDFGLVYVFQIAFIVLNAVLLCYEILLMKASSVSYWSDLWHYIDLLRAVISLLWAAIPAWRSLHFLVVSLCFLRGFTFFSTFQMTRIFVRIIIEVVKEMYAFLTIMAYSTCAFGMMFAVLSDDTSAFSAWKVAYELLMGNFDTGEFGAMQWVCFTSASLLNVIIMLNLLISILGDAYDRAQMYAQENDCLEKIHLIIEYESLFFYKRGQGTPAVLAVCTAMKTTQREDLWEGRINQIVKGVRDEVEKLREDFLQQLQQQREAVDSMEHSLREKLEEVLQAVKRKE